ncbi:M48 family metalloprotease [Actinoplanes sp. TBRC 11911]|uniref:M48 family metallopeptidase n=1 Tax=Actinoplanes sp. TBRC 11911 TaxID=2729386 RepID=UPI00145DFDDD|nr:M48 family metallopeptidase [Actinoplanes sp. TBRC 11911]NMO53931.1 M48 family metalloprotease [Actinoplanes sp. TBRC 11911]
MATLARALKIITLLLGFYLLCVVLLAGLVVVDYFALDTSSAWHVPKLIFLLLAATVGVFIVVVRGLFVSVRVRQKDLNGLPVSRAEQPALWQRVTALAETVGTRPPAEIRLVPQVNAAVLEHAHLMGLLPGKRRMMIGVPLMQALTVPELDAVLAHELGHYSDRHSRLAPLAGRARASVMGTLKAVSRQRTGGRFKWPGSDAYAALFHAYAGLVLRHTFAISREQEYAADRIAAQAGGRANAASALRKLPATDAAYDYYLNEFIGLGLRNKLVPPPPEVLGGFGRFLVDPERMKEMAELGDPDDSDEAHAFDSHPPIADRIAAIMTLPDDGRPPAEAAGGHETRAFALLHNPVAVLTALGIEMVGKHAAAAQVADWDTIARTARLGGAQENSKPIQHLVSSMIGRPARFTDFLALVEAGRLSEILERMDRTETAMRLKVPPPAQREFKKNALGRMLVGWAVFELVPSGRATIEHSWSGFGGEMKFAGLDDKALTEGVEALLTMWPDTALIRQVVPA